MTNNSKLKDKCLSLAENGATIKEIKSFISKSTGFKKTKVGEIYRDIFPVSSVISEDFWEENLEVLDKPYFNKDTKQYIVFLNSLGRNVVVSEDKHRSILQQYSNFDNEEKSISEICRNVQWPRQALTEYLKKFGINHDTLPLTDEDLAGQSNEELVSRLIELRKFSIHQKFEKESWDNIRGEAQKWREFIHKGYNPVQEVINKWVPPKLNKLVPAKSNNSNLCFVAGLQDIHIGEITNQCKLFAGEKYNSEIAIKNIDSYASNIKQTINDRKSKFGLGEIIVNGDFLHSHTDSKTVKGTNLHSDLVESDLFETGLNSLVRFIERFLEIFPKVNVRINFGNHDGFVLSCLGIAAKQYFKDNPNVYIDVSKSWASIFKINNVLVMAAHGSHDKYKHAFPKGGSPLEAYISRMLLARMGEFGKVTQKVCLIGHRHSFSQQDINGIEFYTFGSPVKGDQFADAGNYRSSPRFNSLIIGENSIQETLHHLI